MYFLQAVAAPIIITLKDPNPVKDRVLYVERCNIEYFIDWSNQIAAERLRKATENLDDIRRAEYMRFYPPIPPDINEMRQLVLTPDGFRRILIDRLPTARVTTLSGEELPYLSVADVEEIIKVNGAGRSSNIAWAIADLTDNSMRDPTAKPQLSENGGEDPLTRTGTTGQDKSQETGDKQSPSSKQSTPVKTGGSGPSRSSSTASPAHI